MTFDSPSAGTGTGLDIELMHQRVLADEPARLEAQAEDWEAVGAALQSQADALNAHMDRAQRHWSSYAGEAYLEQLRIRRDSLVEAAGVATANAGAWRNVAGAATRARDLMATQYQLWQADKAMATSEAERIEKRLPHDLAAKTIMDTALAEATGYTSGLKAPEPYQPMPAVDLPGEDTPGGDPTGSRGDVPGSSGTGSGVRPDLPGTGSPPASDGPQLQGSGPVSSSPVLTPRPGGGLVPAPGGGGLPIGPGPVPPSRPAPGFPVPGPRPAPGLRPPPVGRTPTLPGSRPGTGFVPRSPRATVRPVIGVRPGSSGMAPSGPGGGGSRTGLTRPVIGSRPGAPLPVRGAVPRPGGSGGTATVPGAGNRPGTPGSRPGASKPLIGRDGVVGGARRPNGPGVRLPRTHSGGIGPNRSVITGVRQAMKPGAGVNGARPVPRAAGRGGASPNPGRGPTLAPEPSRRNRSTDDGSGPGATDGEYIWQVAGVTVPSVITGGDWSGHDHTPGPTPGLRTDPADAPVTDEHATVERLSRRNVEPSESELWSLSGTVPGVFRAPSPRKYDDEW